MVDQVAVERADRPVERYRFVDLAPAADPLCALEEPRSHTVEQAPHRDATLLYVEDNLANLSLVETILLSRPGWRTLPALQVSKTMAGLAISIWPDVIPGRVSIWEAAAPHTSQLFLLVGAVVLIPLILGYTAWSYWVFRGKVDEEGYH